MDENEFTNIVDMTKGIVLAAVRKHLSNRFYHAIDDVVQETYLRAYRGLTKNSFKKESSIETWLFAIAKNESLRMNDKLKREEAKFNKSVIKIKETSLHERYSEKDYLRDQMIFLRKLIDNLPEKYSSVMELVALGFSEKQIAERLNIKKGTVKSRASRGREMIQRIAKEGTKL